MKQIFLDSVQQMLFVTDRFLRVLQLRDYGLLSFAVHVRPKVAEFLKGGSPSSFEPTKFEVTNEDLIKIRIFYDVNIE